MITKDTGIIEAVQNHPEIMEVFAEYGLGCIGCMAAHFETIGQGAGAHGIDVDALIEDINKVIAEGLLRQNRQKNCTNYGRSSWCFFNAALKLLAKKKCELLQLAFFDEILRFV